MLYTTILASIALILGVTANPLSPVKSLANPAKRQATVGGVCGVNEGIQSLCTDPQFPYCVCNYYMPNDEEGEVGESIYVCESTSLGQC